MCLTCLWSAVRGHLDASSRLASVMWLVGIYICGTSAVYTRGASRLPSSNSMQPLEDDSAPILRREILPIEKGSIIADLHELEDGLDDFRRLRVVGRHIGRHVELEREPWRCHRNTVAWVARNRGKRVRSDGQSRVRMDNLTGPPFRVKTDSVHTRLSQYTPDDSTVVSEW